VEGAHSGCGLGHRFLRHVERTRFLVHLLSVTDLSPEDPFAGFALINAELALFSPELAQRRQIEVINKIDLADADTLAALRARAEADGRQVHLISALRGEGLEPLLAEMWRLQAELEEAAPLASFSGVSVAGAAAGSVAGRPEGSGGGPAKAGNAAAAEKGK
jgi:GTP-binding protein